MPRRAIGAGRTTGWWAALALAACGQTGLEPSGHERWPVQELSVEVATEPPIQLRLAGADLRPDGSGEGIEASAVIEGALPWTIVGQRSSWELAQGVVVFEGEVHGTRGPVELFCDRLSMRWQDETFRSAVAEGSVRVTRGDQEARGERAEITMETGRVVITGAPVLQDGGNTLRAEQITLFLDEERAECVGCRMVIREAPAAP